MTSTAPPLSPHSRDAALSEMASADLDILVVGAGVVGAGAALDAATRGLRVGLVEADDYGSGTSNRSTSSDDTNERVKETSGPFRIVSEYLGSLPPLASTRVPLCTSCRTWAGAFTG